MRSQPFNSYKDPNNGTPGRFKASLTLADGPFAALGNSLTVLCLILLFAVNPVYHFSSPQFFSPVQPASPYNNNTITTSKGEIFTTVLSDGSKIWLNSESSIHYPVGFNGEKGKVEIPGEAYFEVAHDANRPFRIDVKGTVLPDTKGELEIMSDVDVEQAVAWQNGYFQFNKDDLQTIMRQLSRWYDVQVVYEGKRITISGKDAAPDKDAEPVAGVNIQVKGTMFTTQANENGELQLDNIEDNAGLNISSVGQRSLNTTDIESIAMVKDADATAIYGCQNANRVISMTINKKKIRIAGYYPINELA